MIAVDKQDVITFFNRLAPSWDADMVRDDRIIGIILDKGGVQAGKRILDVACGTGVLFPDYLKRDVASVTGVDISPEMARIAGEKFAGEEKIRVLCADVQEVCFAERFDCIIIYNAFPHFSEPETLFARLQTLLVPGGRLTVAHGMSRKKIDAHHSGDARKVSMGLMHQDALAALMGRFVTVDTVISDEEKYIVSGYAG